MTRIRWRLFLVFPRLRGITRVNEPVEELLARFNDAAIDLLLERGVELTDAFPDPVPMVLAARRHDWAGRHQPSVIARRG